MKKDLVLFDLDGTLTEKDTLIEFIRFYAGTFSLLFGALMNLPWLIGLKLGVIPNNVVKTRILSYFFKGVKKDHFQSVCDGFARDRLPKLCRPEAMKLLSEYKKNDVRIIVVSASPENWIRQWAELNGFGLIATRLEIKNDFLTGKIDGQNCYGSEKKKRILSEVDLNEYRDIIAYGDSKGDVEMLSLASKSYFQYF